MSHSTWGKPLILFTVILSVISTTFLFAVLHREDGDNRVSYSLLDVNAQRISQQDLEGKYQLVFFGFTNCGNICPTQMSKLTRAMHTLDATGHGQRVTPVFISVDPERDKPETVKTYLKYFDDRFVGLTGSRTALAAAADSFKTFLQTVPEEQRTEGYQVTHSSIVYVVDPFSRIVDYIPFEEGHEAIAERIRKII